MAKDTQKCTCVQGKIVNLCYKDAKHPFHRLPFVAADLSSFWDVPATGGYEGGWRTGAALATAYMRYLAGREKRETLSRLGMIVLAMFTRLAKENDDENTTIDGQIMGFMNIVEHYAHYSARDHVTYLLRKVSDAQIISGANAGIEESSD